MKAFAVCLTAGLLAMALVACGGDDSDDAPAAASTVALDSSFGTNGIAQVPLNANSNDRFMAIAAGPDGKTYGAGFITQGGDQLLAVARVDASGKLDSTFGTNGIASVNAAAGGKTVEVARSVILQSGGKVVIAGPIEHDVAAAGDAARDTDVAVARFDASGKLDASFGNAGVARIDLGTGKATSATGFVGDNPWGMGALANDKIAIFATKLAEGAERTDADFVVVGLNSAGALDSGFGTNGQLVVDLGRSGDNPRHVMVQPDGKILATGYSSGADGVVSPVIIRLSATGVLDSSFGSGGIATAKVLPGVAESYAVSMQGSDYIIAGYGRGADTAEKVDLIVERFQANGTWDRSFGADGVTRIDIAKEDDRARNVLVLPDGRILAVGSGKRTAANIDAMMVLLTKDGKADAGFGESGILISDLGGPADAWYGVALSADKKSVIVAGYRGVDATSGGNDDAVVARVIL